MVIEATEQKFGLLYSRARESYAQCINNKENGYLKEEMDAPLEAIAVRDATIKIAFHQNFIADYQVEVELSLYISDNYIGKCTYCENKKGDEIENGLVFY